MSVLHTLKVDQPFFDSLLSGAKTFEVRKNDRNYLPGDELLLMEWTGEHFTGREVDRVVTYVLREAERYGVQPGYVVLGLRPVDRFTPAPEWVTPLLNSLCSHGRRVEVSTGGIFKGQLIHRTGGRPCTSPEPIGQLYVKEEK